MSQFNNFENGRLADTKTDFFYKEIAAPFLAKLKEEIECTYFDLRSYEEPLRSSDKKDDVKLIDLFKILSPEHFLKLPFVNDSNKLNKDFYQELLHIIGLTETGEDQNLIERKKEEERYSGSLIENTILQLESLDKLSPLENLHQYGATRDEQLFNVALELVITWINRILFLKLLEAQLLIFHEGDKSYIFLSSDQIKDYDVLHTLFFQVLARKYEERNDEIKKTFSSCSVLKQFSF